jgi:hypothetical protein
VRLFLLGNRILQVFSTDCKRSQWELLDFYLKEEKEMKNEFGISLAEAAVKLAVMQSSIDWLLEQGLLASISGPDGELMILADSIQGLRELERERRGGNHDYRVQTWMEQCRTYSGAYPADDGDG